MSVDVSDVLADLVAEQQDLDDSIGQLDASAWSTPTASARWSIADQIGHLAYFDGTAALAISDPSSFQASLADLLEHIGNDETMDEVTLGQYRTMEPDELLAAWRNNRADLAEAATTLENNTRVAWYGPSMGAKSFLTARLMECWAHGQDIIDAAGLERTPTDRIAHIVRLGVNTRSWSYANRELETPSSEVFVDLQSPSAGSWVFGDPGAAQSISGAAVDFCLVVTQRRHVDATELTVVGDDARDWMLKAQAFAGSPTSGPAA